MKSVILAAGYATRLFPLTENWPKPLLRIGETTILDRLTDDLDTIDLIDEHLVVTNHKFVNIFKKWATSRMESKGGLAKKIRILDDRSENNENRLGAVRDLVLAINSFSIHDDIIVLAADNILDFSLRAFVREFISKQTSMIMCHQEEDVKSLQRTGVVLFDDNLRVIQMQEKPDVPLSHWAVPPFYIYRKEDIPIILEALESGCGVDAPGDLAKYMVEASTIHVWQMPGARYDVGSLESYYRLVNR